MPMLALTLCLKVTISILGQVLFWAQGDSPILRNCLSFEQQLANLTTPLNTALSDPNPDRDSGHNTKETEWKKTTRHGPV